MTKDVYQSKYVIGECYFYLGNYAKSKQIFDELSSDELSQYRLIIDRIRINFYYARIYQELGESEKSLEYLELFNEKLAQYYRKTSDEKISVFTKNELNEKQKIISNLDNAYKKIEQKDNYLKIGISSLILVFIMVFIYLKYQRKQYQKKVEKLLFHIKKLENTNQDPAVIIEEEKAKQILTKLKKIEKQQLFLSQSYSLNKIAKKIGSNSTYVSKAVNTYWNKSFTDYTNELRINYILLKLKQDTTYQKFKLEAIAESVGYKSLRSFNKHFKSHTGIMPKQYIELVKKNTKQSV